MGIRTVQHVRNFFNFCWFDVIISVQDLVIKSKWFYTVTFKNFKICSNDQSQIDNFSEPWLLTNSCVRWSNTGQSPLNAFSKFAEFCTRMLDTYTCSILIRKPIVQKRLSRTCVRFEIIWGHFVLKFENFYIKTINSFHMTISSNRRWIYRKWKVFPIQSNPVERFFLLKFAEPCTRILGTYTCSVLIRKPTVQK